MDTDLFEKAEAGLDVYYYPRGIKSSEGTPPHIGKIRWPHPGGVADLAVLPDTDGTVHVEDMVPHISQTIDPNTGRISANAERRGAWELTPWSLHYLKSIHKQTKKTAEKE